MIHWTKAIFGHDRSDRLVERMVQNRFIKHRAFRRGGFTIPPKILLISLGNSETPIGSLRLVRLDHNDPANAETVGQHSEPR